MGEDITLSGLQALIEKIIDSYPDDLAADDPDIDRMMDELQCLAKKYGIPFIIVIRAYKIVCDLRARRKS